MKIVITLILLIMLTPYYKKIPRKMTAIFALSSMAICGLIMLTLVNSDNFEFMALNTKPLCHNDGVEFVTDTCSKCDSNVIETGYFRNSETLVLTEFNEKFKDFSDYKSSYTFNKILTLIFVVLIIFSVYNIIIHFLQGFSTDEYKAQATFERRAKKIMKFDSSMSKNKSKKVYDIKKKEEQKNE